MRTLVLVLAALLLVPPAVSALPYDKYVGAGVGTYTKGTLKCPVSPANLVVQRDPFLGSLGYWHVELLQGYASTSMACTQPHSRSVFGVTGSPSTGFSASKTTSCGTTTLSIGPLGTSTLVKYSECSGAWTFEGSVAFA